MFQGVVALAHWRGTCLLAFLLSKLVGEPVGDHSLRFRTIKDCLRMMGITYAIFTAETPEE